MSDGELRAEAEKLARAILSHPDSSAWCHASDKRFVSVIADGLLAFARLERLRGRIEQATLDSACARQFMEREPDNLDVGEEVAAVISCQADLLRAELAELERKEEV